MATPARPEFACFVTGTDTGVGKTWVSAALLEALALRGRRVAGMKPIACGAPASATGLFHADALLLQAQCTAAIEYADVNPYPLRDPVAPHIAATLAGTRIELAPILAAYGRLCAQAEAVVVEGIGGWRVPLGPALQTADLVRAFGIPVLLVVGLRLGCINHALLSAECIAADGLRLAGWVANHVEPGYQQAERTLEYLQANIPAPMIGCIPHHAGGHPRTSVAHLDLTLLPDA